jgi:hypothetical protein
VVALAIEVCETEIFARIAVQCVDLAFSREFEQSGFLRVVSMVADGREFRGEYLQIRVRTI